MKNEDEFLRICTRPLEDDPELARATRLELENYFDAKTAQLRDEGIPEEECFERAAAEFGAPDEIGAELLRANFPRIRLRAKCSLVLKLVLLPLTLIALVATLDLAMMASAVEWWMWPSQYIRSSFFSHAYSIGRLVYQYRHSCPDKYTREQSIRLFGTEDGPDFGFFYHYQPRPGKKSVAELKKELVDRYPDDLLARYEYLSVLPGSLSQLPAEERNDILRREFAKAMKLDPDNAAYHYMLAGMLAQPREILTSNPKPGTTVRVVEEDVDPALLAEAMAELRKGLALPYCRFFSKEIIDRNQRELNWPDTVSGRISAVLTTSQTPLSYIQVLRNLARALPKYARQLQQEGKTQEAEFFLDAWLPFLRQVNRPPQGDLLWDQFIFQLTLNIMNKEVPAVYEAMGMPEKAALSRRRLDIALAPYADFRREGKSFDDASLPPELVGRMGLVAYASFPRDLPHLYAVTPAQLAPELRLNYTFLDTMLLGLFGFEIALLALGGVMALGVWRIFAVKPFFVFLPLRTYGKIALYGVVIPLAVFLLWREFDWLSGRDWAPDFGRWRTWAPGIYFLVGFPVIQILVVRHYLMRRLRPLYPTADLEMRWRRRAVVVLNLIPALVGLLLLLTLILRPYYRWEEHRYLAQDHWVLDRTDPLNYGIDLRERQQEQQQALAAAAREI